MADPSYNKFSAIQIGGTFVNNIPTASFGNVSLDVSGHTFLNGNLYVAGATNISGNGAFSGTDLSLNGNLYLGGKIIPRNATNVFEVSANNLYFDVSDNMAFYSRGDMVFQPSGAGSLYFQPQGTGNLVFGTLGGDAVFDASQNGTFYARNGDLTFQTDASGTSIIINPEGTGETGNFIVNGKLRISDGIFSTNSGDIFQLNSRYVDLLGPASDIYTTYKITSDGTKTMTIGMDTTEGFIGTAGTNMDLSIGASRYIRLSQPIYVDYVYADISRNNNQIGWTQNTANPNTGTSYTGTASDTTTPAQVGTFTLPTAGVWLIQFDCLLTLNTGSDTITNKEIVLSETTASLVPCAPAFHYKDPIDDAAGAASDRQIFSFCGVYHNTSATKQLYINVIASTSGSRTVTASGDYKYTRFA